MDVTCEGETLRELCCSVMDVGVELRLQEAAQLGTDQAAKLQLGKTASLTDDPKRAEAVWRL